MRSLLLICLGFFVFYVNAIHVISDASTRAGRPIPLHIPTQTVDSNDTFEVPYWLGAYYVTTNVSSNWLLPLTIGNGGQTYPGEFLIIKNNGPANITLLPQSSETIEGASSYSIYAGSIIEILSGYPDWTVVIVSTSNQPEQWINVWIGKNTATSERMSTVAIGPGTANPPSALACDPLTTSGCNNWYCVNTGELAGESNMGNYVVNNGYRSGQYNRGIGVFNVGSNAGRNNSGDNVVNIGRTAGTLNSGAEVINLGTNAGAINSGQYVINMGVNAGQYNTGSGVFNIGRFSGRYNTGSNVVNIGESSGINNTGSFCYHNGNNAGSLNTFNYCYTNGRSSTCTAENQFVFGSGGFPLHLRLPSDTGSYCTGTAYDTCLNRAAANAWTFNAGTSLRIPQALNLGTMAAPANTATGAFSTTKSTPTLQAFGAVTANAASGILAFTVNTAAGVCGAAVVTNTNVVAGSEVILTIQKYTGQYITNGTPMVTREDTSGSSVGNFNLNLCNIHSTNALNGNLYIAFWVLN